MGNLLWGITPPIYYGKCEKLLKKMTRDYCLAFFIEQLNSS